MATVTSTAVRAEGAGGGTIGGQRSRWPAHVIWPASSQSPTMPAINHLGRSRGAIHSPSGARKLEVVLGPMSPPGPLSCRSFS